MKNPTYASLLAGLLVLAGCSGDNLTSPARMPSAPALYDHVAGGAPRLPKLIPNSVKSSDHGLHPATGRSGSAQLTSRALLGKDGYTDLEITTGELDVGTVPPGNLSKIQVKGFNAHGALRSTINYNHLRAGGYAHYRYAGYARGNTIQVQSNVTGIDRRTDVVTVRDMVALRPDLAVTDLTAPDAAVVDLPVQIYATVSELNGDVGAHAECVLSVDGAQVDEAAGIWVDAGSHAVCMFSHVFAQTGTHTLEVSAEDVTPGDWDLSNNSATRPIAITSAGIALHGSALASDVTGQSAAYDSTGTPDDYTIHRSGDSGRQQQVLLSGGAAGIQGSLDGMSVVEKSNGVSTTTLTAGSGWTSDDGTMSCSTAFSTGSTSLNYAQLVFCRRNDGSSGFAQYNRFEVQDVYYSQAFHCYFLSAGSAQTCDVVDDQHATMGSSSGFTTFGPTLEVRLEATVGGSLYVADPTIVLTASSGGYSVPLSCSHPSSTDPTYFTCSSFESSSTGVQGSMVF